MGLYTVYGTARVAIAMIDVEAESEADALEKAFEQCDCLSNYCGNGGAGDKLVGVDEENVSLGDSEIEWEGADEVLF